MTAPSPWIDLFIISMYVRLTVNLLTACACLIGIFFLRRTKQARLQFINSYLFGSVLFFFIFSIATVIGLVGGSYAVYDYNNIVIAVLITIGSIIYAISLTRFLGVLFGGNHDE